MIAICGSVSVWGKEGHLMSSTRSKAGSRGSPGRATFIKLRKKDIRVDTDDITHTADRRSASQEAGAATIFSLEGTDSSAAPSG